MSFRYPGGLLTTTGPVSAQYPSGVWTQQQVAPYQAQGVFAADPQFKYTTLLLNGNGTNGAQNNTFLDSSTNAFSITRNGNATQGTFSPYVPNGYWSNYFGGSGNSLNYPSASQYAIGTGNFTLEFFVNFSSLNAGHNRMFCIGASGTDGLEVDLNGTTLEVGIQNGYPISYTWTPTVGVWYYVAVTRSGSSVTFYINGTSVATGTSSNNISQNSLSVGGISWQSTWSINGYLSNVRLSNSVRTIATPTAPYTSDANTLFLGCQANRFLDVSSYAAAVTLTGSPSVQSFQPFPPTTASSAAVTGGSGYFDGSGDYLSVADNAALEPGSGNFTLECWFYVPSGSTVSANGRTLLSKSNTSSFGPFNIGFNPSTGRLDALSSTSGSNWEISCSATQTYTTLKGAWHHAAYVRSGSSFTLYIDGVSAATASSSSALVNNTDSFMVGYINYPSTYFDGYITNARLVIGTAVYTGTFTPPTAPLTAVSGTQLLCNMTNAGIQDSTMGNDLETVGNAQVSTSIVKYGSGSLYFDGSGDWLDFPSNPTVNFGTGDFTIECWLYVATTATTYQTICQFGDAATTTGFHILANTNLVCVRTNSGQPLTTTGTITATTWNHIAVTRSSGTTRIFINGVTSGGTYSWTASLTAGSVRRVGSDTYSNPLNGYIDEFRVTSGYARYTANFTPPIAPFPKQ